MYFELLTFTIVLRSLNYFGYIIPVSIKVENMNIFQIFFFHYTSTLTKFHWVASETVLPTQSVSTGPG
jgi:hypothetical protein